MGGTATAAMPLDLRNDTGENGRGIAAWTTNGKI
jgi:hypothetical protein